ncbi:hypothetical protein KKA17_09655 [bacterium]|nr:hypothetical protein [bacterium]MBU1884569.1 hypothetical protein [bacterium]
MKKSILLIASVSILLLSGCGSNKSDPKEVAQHVCEALKNMDFEELKKYTDEESTKQIELGQKRIEEAKSQIEALPEEQRENVKKIYENQMAVVKQKMATINCENIVMKDGGDKEESIALIDGKPTKLKLIDGNWKLTK